MSEVFTDTISMIKYTLSSGNDPDPYMTLLACPAVSTASLHLPWLCSHGNTHQNGKRPAESLGFRKSVQQLK